MPWQYTVYTCEEVPISFDIALKFVPLCLFTGRLLSIGLRSTDVTLSQLKGSTTVSNDTFYSVLNVLILLSVMNNFSLFRRKTFLH